ncbi:MAG: CocE/NonD family hydrolase, partial [Pseudomonadota bacterium]
MKKIKISLVIGLALSLALSLANIALAQSEKDRPFNGSYTATYKVDSKHAYKIESRDFTNIRSFYTGEGNFSYLSSSKVVGQGIWVWDESIGTLRDEITLTAPTFERVYARITGTQSGSQFRGTYIIWGGTGIYTKATGSGTVSATLNTTPDGGTITASMDGTITYPPQPPLPKPVQPAPAPATGVNGAPAPHLVPRPLIATYDPTTPWKHLVERMIVEKDVPIPTRDGLRLSGDVYRPARPGKYPVVLTYTVFAKDYNWQTGYPGWDAAYEPWICATMDTAPFEAPDPAFWVPLDYAVVIVDPRGVSRSPGTRKTDSWDAYDAVEWAGAQEWSNGNVGTSGVSALGGFQLGVAALNPPSLKAIAPWEGSGTGNWRQGGVTRTLEIGRMLAVPRNPAWDPPAVERQDDPNPKPWYEQYAGIKAPMVVGASWSSHGLLTEPAFNHWRFVGSQKWLYSHGREKWAPYYQTEYLAMLIEHFGHFLKGNDDRILDTPRVRVEVRDTRYTYTVRMEDDFPIPRTEYKEIYLDANGAKLDFKKPAASGSLSYLSTTEESAKFDYTFAEDTELTGYMKVKLYLAPVDADDADIFVTLRKFDRNGKEVF